jgi:hypothetical protein
MNVSGTDQDLTSINAYGSIENSFDKHNPILKIRVSALADLPEIWPQTLIGVVTTSEQPHIKRAFASMTLAS